MRTKRQGLTDEQVRAAQALARGCRQRQAADEAGVGYRSVQRWCETNTAFRQKVHELVIERSEAIRKELETELLLSYKVVESCINGKIPPTSTAYKLARRRVGDFLRGSTIRYTGLDAAAEQRLYDLMLIDGAVALVWKTKIGDPDIWLAKRLKIPARGRLPNW